MCAIVLGDDPDACRRHHQGYLERRQHQGHPAYFSRSWPVVQRKLDQVDSVTKLEDLKVPPGNRLHALVDDRADYHAIRVNDQYRIIFRFAGHDAYEVRCADYH